MLNKKHIFYIFCTILVVAVISFIGVKVYLQQSVEHISISLNDCKRAESTTINEFPFYTLGDHEYFYSYMDKNGDGVFSVEKTEYLVSDYIPYWMTVEIQNHSRVEILHSRLIGVYSKSCVLTKTTSESGWFGESIAPGECKEEKLLIWFNKDMTEEQINLYLQEISFSYELTGNFSLTKNGYVPKNVTVVCQVHS